MAHSGPVDMRPSRLSKLNTLMQISLIGIILVEKAGYSTYAGLVAVMIDGVFVTTVASGLHYLWSWGILKDIEPAAKGQGGTGQRSGKRTRRQS